MKDATQLPQKWTFLSQDMFFFFLSFFIPQECQDTDWKVQQNGYLQYNTNFLGQILISFYLLSWNNGFSHLVAEFF